MDATTNKAAKTEYVMMDKKGDAYPIDQEMDGIIHEVFKRMAESSELGDFVAAANDEIYDRYGSNIDIIGPLGVVKVKSRITAIINNLSRLKVVLGDQQDLITDEDIATDAVLEIACDADNPLAPRVRECITLKRVGNTLWGLKR